MLQDIIAGQKAEMEKKLKGMGWTKWRCDRCGDFAMSDKNTLREIGIPYCSECDCEMS